MRSCTGLRSTYALLNGVTYFFSVVIGARPKLNLIFKKVCERARRFYEIASFYQYAIADGIHRLLFASEGRFGERDRRRHPARQMLFPFARAPT